MQKLIEVSCECGWVDTRLMGDSIPEHACYLDAGEDETV